MYRFSLFILALLWVLPARSPAQSLGAVEIFVERPAGGNREMNLDQVRNQTFEPKAKDLLNFDYSNAIYWLRFTVSHPEANSEPLVLEIPTSWLDHVTLFGPETEETWGDTLPSPQPKAFRYPTFFLKGTPGETTQYYLRVLGEDALVLPLNVTTVPAFYDHALTRAYGLGAYAGLILVLTLYNFIVYVSLRDRNYLFYVLYILSMGVMQALYEGFGIPILEAYACHCPVALSNTSCFPEIAGDAAVYFDPYSISSMSEAITKVGATSVKEMGKVMAELKDKLQGRADLTQISAKIKTHLT